MLEQRHCRTPVAIEMGQQLQAEIQRHYCVRNVSRSDHLENGRPAERGFKRRHCEIVPRADPFLHRLSQTGSRSGSRDHLHEDGSIARIEVFTEDLGSKCYKVAGLVHGLERSLVALSPSLAHLVKRGEKQVHDRTEVVEDEALVTTGSPGDRTSGCPSEALGPKDIESRTHQGSTGVSRTLVGPPGASRPHHLKTPRLSCADALSTCSMYYRLPPCTRASAPMAKPLYHESPRQGGRATCRSRYEVRRSPGEVRHCRRPRVEKHRPWDKPRRLSLPDPSTWPRSWAPSGSSRCSPELFRVLENLRRDDSQVRTIRPSGSLERSGAPDQPASPIPIAMRIRLDRAECALCVRSCLGRPIQYSRRE